MAKKSVRQLDVRGKQVFLRADLNVPFDSQLHVTDDRRIRGFLPTLKDVVSRGGRAIVASHLGRPEGKDPAADAKFSLKPVAERMSQLLGQPVKFAGKVMGPEVEAQVAALKDGEVLLLENVRFHKGEDVIDKAKKNPDGKLTPEQEAKRQDLAKGLTKLAQLYVNDAFGTCHRKHVSMYDVPNMLPKGTRALGFLVEKEVQYLGDALANPKRPFVAVLGGAKVSDKIKVIENLLPKVDHILIGGAMMFTFWAAQGKSVGKSLCEREQLDLARSLLEKGKGKIVLPTDTVAATELKAGVKTQVVSGEVPAELMGLDVGPKTIEAFGKILTAAKTIVWNGPLGAFEIEPFDRATVDAAQHAAKRAREGRLVSVAGGGDTVAALNQAGVADDFTYVSTAGGAFLEWMEGKELPGVKVLEA